MLGVPLLSIIVTDRATSAACSASTRRARRRAPRLLRAVRAPAPRPGVGRASPPRRWAARSWATREQGLVSQVFDEHMLRSLVGDLAIGHVRYSTTGSSEWENAQPIVRDDHRTLALAHNGNLINAVELHAELRGRDVPFRSTSDSEIIAALLATHPADTHRGGRRRRAAAAAGRVLDRGDDRGRGRRLPRPARPAAARARA